MPGLGWRGACGAIVLSCLPAIAQSAQQAADFKALYAEAEYEKALGLLGSGDTLEVYQYRALCLLALGRTDEAAAAVKSLVTVAPAFVPSAEEAPPRFVELVADTRKALLPVIARRAFAEGRERFGDKRATEAIDRFTLVLALTADPAFEDKATAQDLKTLAQGFIDLARASAPPPKATSAPERSAEAPSPAPARATKVTAPVALSQSVPPVPTTILGNMGPKLVVVVQIDATGKVTSAAVQQSAHPVYDRMVVQAARAWRYMPGTINGVAISAEQVVTIQPNR